MLKKTTFVKNDLETMKKILVYAFAILAIYGKAQTNSLKKSQPLDQTTPEAAGFSSERLGRISQMIKDNIANNTIPGAVTLVARNGHIVYQEAFGCSDCSTGRKTKIDDIYRIASMTKAITATGIMMLWEQGRIMLDDPISRYIPEFKNPMVLESFKMADSSYTTKPAGREITIRQLLSHTSGLGYGVIDSDERMKAIYKKAGIVDLFTTEPVSIAENIKKLAKLPLHAIPGEKYIYSEGLDVMGYLIEVVSGKPFDVFLKDHIFTPLGMTDTHFYLPQSKADRLVKIQTKKDGQWVNFKDNFYDPDYPVKGAQKFFSGGAGLSSTAKDYASFLLMYLNKGELNGKRLLSRTTVNSILQGQTGSLMGGDNTNKQYGLAFGVFNKKAEATAGQGSEGTFDWGGYFNTSYFADPKENIIGIIMKQTQRIADDRTSALFRQMVMSSIDD
jgi:CubicO group peptidase (beta-lactamase class C family)